jgi:acyl-CoA synthetase (AMP-forming)/AMP-acid ligase II
MRRADTLARLLAAQADELGGSIAYRYLADGERDERILTFADVDAQARAVAARLQLAAVMPGDRALIVAADDLDFIRAFMGCQYAGVIAVPVYPPLSPNSPRQIATIRGIARGCGASVVLCDSPLLREWVCSNAPDLSCLPWIPLEQLTPDTTLAFRAVHVRADDVAFLQYTSGSTSVPKGVIVTHRALMHNEELISKCFGVRRGMIVVAWLPLFHDMGLIGVVLQTLYSGLQSVLLPPLSFVQRPVRWLSAITRYGAEGSAAPNFGYELCVRRVTPEERSELDLSTWEVAVVGAEPVRSQTLHAFAETFAPCGFNEKAWHPGYGLAEATLLVTCGGKSVGMTQLRVETAALQEGRVVPGGDQALVGCGVPMLHRRVEVVDPATGVRAQPDVVGEIWVAGPDLASGYWVSPDQTAAAFGQTIEPAGEQGFLRTGDLGFIHDGELFVAGRLKDLIIVAGRNYHPQDIEATVERAHSAIRQGCCAAFSLERGGTEQLIVLAEVRGDVENEDDRELIVRAVRAAVASDHGINVNQVRLVPPRSLPKTSSGKLCRWVCREQFESESVCSVTSAGVESHGIA